MVKYSFLDEKIVYPSFYGALLTFSYFSSGKSSLFRHAWASRSGSVYCLNCSEDLRWKNDISSFIWHKSFIQTVKCSFFSQIIVYQSFHGTLLTFSYFFPQGKVLCLDMRRQVACEMFTVWSVPKTLLKKWHLQLHLTQTIHSNDKMFFL